MKSVIPQGSFPLFYNEDGSIGKRFDLGHGGYIQVNDATMVADMANIHKSFNDVCEEFHNRLMSMGVKAYRCNDGWVDRVACKMTLFVDECTKGYYWYGHVEVGDKVFIGNSHDGGRFAEVLSVKESVLGSSLDIFYKPLQEVLDGKDRKYITEHNAPKYTFLDWLSGKARPSLVTDIYERYPIPERCCARCVFFDTECKFCYKGCRVEDCFEPTDCEWYGEDEEIEDEEIPF